MKPLISDHSSKVFAELFCANPHELVPNILRESPDIKHFRYLEYSEDKYRDAIHQEIKERWMKLNNGKSPNPITNEGAYRKITKQVHAKYQQLHREHRARTLLWLQSERTLNILRTKGQTPPPTEDQVDSAMFEFIKNLDLTRFPEIEEGLPQLGPNEYFELCRPQIVADWGFPFYTTVPAQRPCAPFYSQFNAPLVETIVGINCDFWAAFLCGDKRLGHDCVFFVPESRFYFFDVLVGSYLPTSEEKVRLLASQSLQNRAWGQEATVASTILNDFRTKKVLDEILSKAKSILSANAGYLQGADARHKWNGAQMPGEVQVVVDSFVKEHVEPDDGGIMTLGDCLLQLGKTSAALANKKELIAKVNETIRSTFNRGLRNDLRLPDNRTVAGWKGLKLRVAKNQDKDTGVIHDSAPSEPSADPVDGKSQPLVLSS